MVPLSAHALFARPLVVGPDSSLAVELLERSVGTGVLWCDGRRTFDLPRGGTRRRAPLPDPGAARPAATRARSPTAWSTSSGFPWPDGVARGDASGVGAPVIEEISIRDLGVIGEARLPLGPGFTALTGETGAGKTMVVTALGLLLGERADSGAIRSGAEQTVVEGHWEVPDSGAVAERVRDAGGDLDAGADGRASLVLGRSVSSEGRSRASVGGRAAPVGVLSEIGQQLVVVHGQSDQIRLRSATAQRDALDRFAGPEFAVLLGDYQDVFRRWQTNQGELDVLVAERDRRAREAEELRQAMDEIEAAAPRRGEDAELAERAERLTNLEDLRIAAVEAQEAVSSQQTDGRDAVSLDRGGPAGRRAGRRATTRRSLRSPSRWRRRRSRSPRSRASSRAISARSTPTPAASSRRCRSDAPISPRSRAATARRSTTSSTISIPAAAGSLELDSDADRIEALDRRGRGRPTPRSTELADQLSARRRDAAARLAEAVSAELAALAMPDARLTIDVAARRSHADRPRPGRRSCSSRTRAPSRARSAEGASGGELSRVMLAIEVVLAGSDPVPTFVFDEVDAGVGGASATEIGRRLARLAETRPGHRRHAPRPGRGLLEQPPRGREGQRRLGHREQRATRRTPRTVRRRWRDC